LSFRTSILSTSLPIRCRKHFAKNTKPTNTVVDTVLITPFVSREVECKYTFWGVMGHAPHAHMEKAFAQRRELIIGDNLQLKTDVDVYNDVYRGKNPEIQLVLDYTEDVAEREELLKMKNRRDAA